MEEKIEKVVMYLESLGYVLHCESNNWGDKIKRNWFEIVFVPKDFKKEKELDARTLPKTKDGRHHGIIFRIYTQDSNLQKLYFQAYMASNSSTYSFIPGGYLYKGSIRKDNFIPSIELGEVTNFVQQIMKLF